MVTRQVAAEGVKRIAIVTDEPDKYRGVSDLAPGTTIHHRDELWRIITDTATALEQAITAKRASVTV
mgnify:CR=1 FL=1